MQATAYYYIVHENSDGPPWTKAINHVIQNTISKKLTTKQCGVAIIFRITHSSEVRYFSACFGIGRLLLDADSIEQNFGLMTTLNSIKSLRRCTSLLLGAQTRQKSILTNYDARVRELDFDFDEEIIALASGRCPKNDLGTTISGTDSLKLSAPISFEQIPGKLHDIYARYNMKTYQDNGFDFLDQVVPVRDSNIINALYARLLKEYNGPSGGQLSAMAPLDADNESISSYRISGRGRREEMPEVTLDNLRDYSGSVDIDELCDSIKIQGYDSSGTSTTINAPMSAYLIFETEYKKQKYVLANRKWYQIESNFLTRINNQAAHQLSAYKGPGSLKIWNTTLVKGKPTYDEGAYNFSYHTDLEYLVLDKKKFSERGYGKGNSIEVADLFHLPTKSLICVKKNTRSATLSHLFAQASVSAEMFLESENYRKRFIEQVREKWPKSTAVTEATLKDLTFIYAIGSESPPPGTTLMDKVLDLPVFSRINMRKHNKRIHGAGHKISLTYIQMI